MPKALVVLACLAGGCATQDVPRAPYVVPASLVLPCLFESDPQTVGDLYEAFASAKLTIAQCDERFSALRELAK
jgi:hypothetical protein